MDYKELLKAHKKFIKSEFRYFFYDGYMKNRSNCWLECDIPPEFEIKKLFAFVRSWDNRFSGDIEKFRLCYKNIYNDLKQLELKSIHSIDFSKTETNEQIKRIFNMVVDCGKNRPEYTDGSKIIHTILPALFVMWDEEIRKGLRQKHHWTWPKDKAEKIDEYVQTFLPQMKDETNEVIATYMEENHHCSQEQAIDQISKKANDYALAKLLDEYNYVKYTLSKKKDP